MKTITTVEELDALPLGAVVMAGEGLDFDDYTIYERWGNGWYAVGIEEKRTSKSILKQDPITVLFPHECPKDVYTLEFVDMEIDLENATVELNQLKNQVAEMAEAVAKAKELEVDHEYVVRALDKERQKVTDLTMREEMYIDVVRNLTQAVSVFNRGCG